MREEWCLPPSTKRWENPATLLLRIPNGTAVSPLLLNLLRVGTEEFPMDKGQSIQFTDKLSTFDRLLEITDQQAKIPEKLGCASEINL